jgi:hypothetical protein
MRRLYGATNVQEQSRLLGYRPGEPGENRVPCVENSIMPADPHTGHNTNYRLEGNFIFRTHKQLKFKTQLQLHWHLSSDSY